MKHIFKGKVIEGKWMCHDNPHQIMVNENFHEVRLGSIFPYMITKWTDIGVFDNLEVKLSSGDCFILAGEEVNITKIVYCDTGDIIYYTDKVVEYYEDIESEVQAKRLQAAYEQRICDEKENSNKVTEKKWYQFWIKE
jgi:hypothetical protein